MVESTSIELLHAVQLDLMARFDKVCRDNGISYFLDSGTALGAVRHHGFIPWDDDVDMGMLREDYERLLDLGAAGLPDNLSLQTYESDPAYMMPFAKIRLGNSYFPEKMTGYDKFRYQGIYIDVFPYDRIPEDAEKARRFIKRSRIWYYLSVFCRRDYPGKKLPQKILTSFLHKLSDKKVAWLHRYYDRYCRKYELTDSRMRTCLCWRMSQRKEYFFKESELLPTKRAMFEGKEFSTVSDPDRYLRIMFGDYMVLPPENERKIHLNGPFRVEDR